MSCEVVVRISDKKRGLTHRRVMGHDIRASWVDKDIEAFVEHVEKEFCGDPSYTKVSVGIKLIGERV